MMLGSQYHAVVDHHLDPFSLSPPPPPPSSSTPSSASTTTSSSTTSTLTLTTTFSPVSSSSSSSSIATLSGNEARFRHDDALMLLAQQEYYRRPPSRDHTGAHPWSNSSCGSSCATTTATSSSILLRSLLMDVGITDLDMDPPAPNSTTNSTTSTNRSNTNNAYNMNFYLDPGSRGGPGGGDSLQDAAAAAASALYGAPPAPPLSLPPQLILGLHTNSATAASVERNEDNDDEMHKLMLQQQNLMQQQQALQHRHTQQQQQQQQHQLLLHQQQQHHHHQLHPHHHPHHPHQPMQQQAHELQDILKRQRLMHPHVTTPITTSSSNINIGQGGVAAAMLHGGQMDTRFLLPARGRSEGGAGPGDECSPAAASVLMQLSGGGGGGGNPTPHQVNPQPSLVTTYHNSNSCSPPPSASAMAASTSASALWLDPRLWSRLPEGLVQRLLACLPLPAFFRCRLVCRRWYSLLFSDSFLEMCADVRPPARWFLLFRKGAWTEAFAFDPSASSSGSGSGSKPWYRLDLSFLPPRFSVVASAGGLLCCISEERGRKTALVCNPLTRAYIQLPPAIKDRFVPTVGLFVDPATKAYRVLAAGDDLISPFAVKNLTTELYDSRLQRWSMTAPLPRLCNLESGKTTYADGYFYCMNYSPFSVLTYDMEAGVWGKIQAPMRRFLRTPNLVECRGRLVLVAAVEKNKLNVPKSIRIWGLQASRATWTELERMPQALYEDFMRVSGQKAFHCTGHGNQILITMPDSPHMLLYDFYEKVWRWAARCPFTRGPGMGTAAAADNPVPGHSSSSTAGIDSQPSCFQAFAYDPRLEALVC